MWKPGKRQAAILSAIVDEDGALCLDESVRRQWWVKGGDDVPAAVADALVKRGWIAHTATTKSLGILIYTLTEAGRSALRAEREG